MLLSISAISFAPPAQEYAVDVLEETASGAKRTFNELTMSVKCHFELFADGRD
jgi:hypothetical protein